MHILKLPNGEYINLSLVQRVEVEEPKILIHWQGGRKTYYSGVDAQAILEELSILSLTFSEQAKASAHEIFATRHNHE